MKLLILLSKNKIIIFDGTTFACTYMYIASHAVAKNDFFFSS